MTIRILKRPILDIYFYCVKNNCFSVLNSDKRMKAISIRISAISNKLTNLAPTNKPNTPPMFDIKSLVFILGICSMTDNNTERAFGFFQAATEKNPENHRALLGLLQTGYPLRRFSEMERMLTAYLDLHPASLDMLYSFAGLLYAQGKVNEARLEIEKILVFEPEHENALELREMLDKMPSVTTSQGLYSKES